MEKAARLLYDYPKEVSALKYLQNLHTHTIYDDGKDTPEALVLTAIEKGFSSLGFSGHAHYPPYADSMSRENTLLYRKEIQRLKEVYKDKLTIYCGLEMEMVSDNDLSGYDYLIGSVHFITCDGKPIPIDHDASILPPAIARYFGGDGLAYAKAYYNTLAQLPKYGSFDILGHFDLITKFSDQIDLFDRNAPEYLSAARDAAEALAGKIPYFEVNSGAIARGYRQTPYPALPLMGMLRELGFGAVITSDCHNKENLDLGFALSAELLKKAGFTQQYILTDTGFQPISL